MKYDVIVIGAGLGGLECGYLLSRAGRRVLVLERGTQPGGCLQSYRRDGLSFDTGFHYVGGVGEGESLYPVFRYLGLADLPWQRMDKAFDLVTIGGRTFPIMQGFDAFVEALTAEFPAEREALRRYADLLQEVLRRQFDEWTPADNGKSAAFFGRLLETGAWDYVQEHFRDPLLREVLGGNALTMELRRQSLPLFSFAHCQAGYLEGSWRLRGGGEQIVRRLVSGIRQCGGTVLCRAEVQELVEKDGRLVAARCADGEVYEADAFLSDVHPAVTCTWLENSRVLRKSYRHRLTAADNTFGLCTVSLRLKPHALPYRNCNHYVYAGRDAWEFYLDEGPVGGVLLSSPVPDDGYARQLDLLTPLTWEHCRHWADTTVGRRGEDYLALKRRLADECLALAGRVIPGISTLVEACYVSTPLTFRDYTCTPQGSAYGLRKDFRQPLMALLSPRTPLPNLWLTGQNLALHGVHGVTMTALQTCAELLGKEWIWNNVLNK